MIGVEQQGSVTNTTLRELFQIEERNSSRVSRIINDAGAEIRPVMGVTSTEFV
jgi:hypothetical protein